MSDIDMTEVDNVTEALTYIYINSRGGGSANEFR